MNYKTSRTEKIRDTIELTDENGKVVKSLDVTLDADIVGKDLMLRWNEFAELTRRLKEAQTAYDKAEFYKIVGAYVKAVDVLFAMVFGEKNRVEIYEFFENSYTEMVQQLVPYIFERVIPAVKASVNKHKNALKTAFKKNLWKA